MSGDGVHGGCPACFTSIGWVDLSHDGILHGRSAAAGGPYFTIHCPRCQEPLRAEGGVGRVYRFRSVRAPSAEGGWWRRWLRLLFGAPVLNESREPRARRRASPGGGGRRTGRRREERKERHGGAERKRPVLGEVIVRRLRELELGPDATLEDVKRRFRELAKRTHPDALSRASTADREAARRRFIEVNRAYREIVQRWPKDAP